MDIGIIIAIVGSSLSVSIVISTLIFIFSRESDRFRKELRQSREEDFKKYREK